MTKQHRCQMKILLVIHGYPPEYNAGSEVSVLGLARALADRHEVNVLTRQENTFLPDYTTCEKTDPGDERVKLHSINLARWRDRYRDPEVDRYFGALLDRIQPDIVHIHHLNHLSTSIVLEAKQRQVPIIFTLHDFWLMCPRGQFIQLSPEKPTDIWALCDGQADRKCAERCYCRYFSGASAEAETDIAYWTDWVSRRMAHIREICEAVSLFIAPSRYLLERFRTAREKSEFGLEPEKLVYLDYGFDRDRLANRRRLPGEPFTFGYIGTHRPAKGVHHLIQAFGQLQNSPRLRIWGRHQMETKALMALEKELPFEVQKRIEWMGEYQNSEIVAAVFNKCDAIVVPSIWAENSPLVIHEALQVRVPVIAANYGGMAEYVRDSINGLLFNHRDPLSLAAQMQRLADDPELARKLGMRGYLQSADGNVFSISDRVLEIERLYARAIDARAIDARAMEKNTTLTGMANKPGPWRITFDTNPDDCNLHCIMCEEHSPYSSLQQQRREAGKPRRRMDIDVIRKIMAESAGTPLREIIPSTMGEPLLYQHFEEILDLCQKYGVKLNLTTNGTFPGRGAKAWAEKIVPVTSDVKISWNGASKETQESIMLGTRWERVLENVKEFTAARDRHAESGGNWCRVTFQLTFLETNLEELAEIVKLAASLGVDRVKGHHLWAHFDEIKSLSMRRSAEAIARWNQAVAAAQTAAERYRKPNGERVLLENIFALDPNEPQEIAPDAVCPFLGREAWVSAEGRFNPCCAPDALRRTLGEFGNLNSQGIWQIWQSQAYQQLCSTYQNHSLCQGCNMRNGE
ncbi:MAG: glycosyltransferase [Hormoscilla sp. GUM202]|nr:glycosyltransferase [Hormoscilla sp. GUM202]